MAFAMFFSAEEKYLTSLHALCVAEAPAVVDRGIGILDGA